MYIFVKFNSILYAANNPQKKKERDVLRSLESFILTNIREKNTAGGIVEQLPRPTFGPIGSLSRGQFRVLRSFNIIETNLAGL